MSTATAVKKKAQPAPATTGRGAALYIALGVALVTLGVAWLFSFYLNTGSKVLSDMRHALLGLCGIFCPAFPVLLIIGGSMLLVSTRHRVSLRNYTLVFCLYILVLVLFTLLGTSGQSTYLDYVGVQNRNSGYPDPTGYASYLNHELKNNNAGGLIGMLIAYPLWKILTQIGGALLVAFFMIVLLFVLFRFNPGETVRRFSDYREKRRAGKAAGQNAAGTSARPAAGYQETAAPQAPSAPMVPDTYDYQSPIYDAQPAGAPIPMQQTEDGFYPVQPDLYEEPFPQQPPVQYTPAPASREQTVRQEKPSFLDRIRNAMNSDQPKTPATPARPAAEPRQTIVQPTKPVQRPAPPAPAPAPKVPAPVQPISQALDDLEDDLPWDEPVNQPAKPIRKPAENKPGQIPAQVIREIARPAEAPASAPKPKPVSADSWADQVRQKTKEMENKPLPGHNSGSGQAKPVYTDPVMPITDEIIPIKPATETKHTLPGAKLDGTSAPTVKQGSMGLNVPYQAPPIRLLKEPRHIPQADAGQEDERRAQVIETTLHSFGVDSEVKQIMHGPAITRFAIQIAPGVKVSRVSNTADNLALELKTQHVRVEAPIQGTNYIGIEVPNQVVSPVFLREVLDSPEMQNNPSPLLVALGKDIAGSPVLCDLSKMPHLLIAGATGSGKSVCINSIVCSLLYRTSPDQVRLIMVDPKQVELSVYNGIPHLLVPVVSDPRKAAGALSWVVQEMLERYGKFSAQNVRNLAGYNKVNQGTDQVLPNIVVIIDEMADLMEVCRKDVEESIRRLAALARAAGIYMVLATQRPSVDVITGVIKNNIPSRIAFAVSSGTDSRTIIDINGAEKLMGKGDMLYKPTGTSPIRVQGCFVSDDEVNAITEYIASRYQTNYDPNIADHLENVGKENAADEIGGLDDAPGGNGGGDGSFGDLLRQAIEMAVEDGQTSTSMLQRRLRVGYARAGRLIDEMEKRGVISHSEGSKPRKTLITREEYYEQYAGEA